MVQCQPAKPASKFLSNAGVSICYHEGYNMRQKLLYILLPFWLGLMGCDKGSQSVLNASQAQKVLKSLEMHTQWWYHERQWYLNSLRKRPSKGDLAAMEGMMIKTDEIIQYIERLKADLTKYVGKGIDPATKMPRRLKNKRQVSQFFKYFEEEFHTKFSLYQHTLRDYASSAQKEQLYNFSGQEEDQSFLQTHLTQTNVIEALQALTLLQVKVFKNEYLIWGNTGFNYRDALPGL